MRSGPRPAAPVIAAIAFGLAMGFLSAVPVAGPVSAMVFERTVDRRYSAALLLAIGTAMAEGVYAALAVLGFAVIADEPWVVPASKGVAGAVLIAVGLSFALRARPPAPEETAEPPIDAKVAPRSTGWGAQWLLGFSITIANPTLIATWAAATSMVVASGWVDLSPVVAVPFGLAVALGVTAWFALLISLARRFTRGLQPLAIGRILRGIGWLLVALGLWFLWLFVAALGAPGPGA